MATARRHDPATTTRFDSMTARLREAWKPLKKPTTSRSFRCQCGRPVFFRNSQCLSCKTPLGYDPKRALLLPLEPAPQGTDESAPNANTTKPTDSTSDEISPTESMTASTAGMALVEPAVERREEWRVFGGEATAQRYVRCGNFHLAAGCNWLVPVDVDPAILAPAHCVACSLNRTIPDLTIPDNQQRWALIELAKRRLVSQLMALGLPVVPKSEDPTHGIAFDFLASVPDGPPVMTGHANGVITLNVDEADDAHREQVRTQMREPYRTLLGHFRHEIGHYYWDALIADTPWLPHVRALFGDDRQDYAAALKSNYDAGPPADWPQRFVSAYASSHPWEDWAETWAHYLHMVDTVDTALSFGIDADEVELDADPWGPEALWRADDAAAPAFLGFLNAWVELTAVLNEMSRSMGEPDFYPFVLPRPSVAKLQLIHLVIHGATPPDPPPELAIDP